jgi:hypothetical protein
MNPTFLGEPLVNEESASKQGFSAMTLPYQIPDETWMLQNVIDDLKRGSLRFALVQIGLSGVEVWR